MYNTAPTIDRDRPDRLSAAEQFWHPSPSTMTMAMGSDSPPNSVIMSTADVVSESSFIPYLLYQDQHPFQKMMNSFPSLSSTCISNQCWSSPPPYPPWRRLSHPKIIRQHRPSNHQESMSSYVISPRPVVPTACSTRSLVPANVFRPSVPMRSGTALLRVPARTHSRIV